MAKDHMLLSRRAMIAGGVALGAGAGLVAAQRTGLPGALVATGRAIPVAFVMDDNATMIDFSGPWEVFQDAGVANVVGFELYTVASGPGPYQTTGSMSGSGADMRMTGLKFTPDYTFDNAPPPKVVVIGAQAGRDDRRKLDWIRSAAVGADVVMSVCTGAFLLANTGLLDGLAATTHHDFYDSFEQRFPKVKLVRGRRFVDNGKLVTAGGLTSGVDAALHVVQRYYGPSVTQAVADYMEYHSDGWKVA